MDGWQGLKRRRGGGVHFLFRTYFGRYNFKNSNLEEGTFFVELSTLGYLGWFGSQIKIKCETDNKNS